MNTNKKPTTAATSKEPPSTGPYRIRMVQNFHLVWLHDNINEVNNDECRDSISKLRQVIKTVNTFTDVDECIDFITDIHEETTFLMVSGSMCQIILPVAQDIFHIIFVYIFRENTACYGQWAQQWPKVKGVYTDITPICEALEQAAQHCDQNSVSISFVKITDGATSQNLDHLDQSFMDTQILKEILLTIDFQQEHFSEFLTFYGKKFVGNRAELNEVEKLRTEYHRHQPIWWYTYQCFLYSMVNRALRLMEVELIIKMGFFVRDLHNHITTLHSEQYGEHHNSDSFTVYRGQGLSQTDFDQLRQTQGGLMSFNNFLSTSLDRAVSLVFAGTDPASADRVGVLFKITINPSTLSSPFTNIGNISHHQDEEEILFSMHSVFRIGQVKQIDKNDHLWQVDLTLTDDNDPQLHALTQRIREETSSGYKGWYRLGQLLIQLGLLDKAEELYEILLKQTDNELEKATLFLHLGLVKTHQGEYTNAIKFYEKSLEINQKILSPTDHILASCYNNVGGLYNNMGEYSKALSYLERVLTIQQRSLPPDHPHVQTVTKSIEIIKKKL